MDFTCSNIPIFFRIRVSDPNSLDPSIRST